VLGVVDPVPVGLLGCTEAVWLECDTAVGLAEFRRCSTSTAAAARATTTRQPTRIGSALPRRGGCCGGKLYPAGGPLTVYGPPYCGPPYCGPPYCGPPVA